MKKVLSVTLVVAFCLLLVMGESFAAPRPISLSLSTGGVGSGNFVSGAIYAQRVSDMSDWVRLTTQASGGAMENVRLVGNRDSDLGVLTTGGVHLGLNSLGDFEGEPPYEDIRLVLVYQTGYNVMVARPGIDSWWDLVGKRVGLGPAGSNVSMYSTAVLRAYGIYDQVDTIQLSFEDMVQKMVDGELDAHMAGNAPFPSTLNLASQMEIKLVSVDPDMFDKISEFAKCFKFEVPPGAFGFYDWHKESIYTTGFSAFLAVHKDVPADAVYEILRVTMEEETLKYLDEHIPNWHFRDAPNQVINYYPTAMVGLRLHEGAIRFWEDYGLTVPDALR